MHTRLCHSAPTDTNDHTASSQGQIAAYMFACTVVTHKNMQAHRHAWTPSTVKKLLIVSGPTSSQESSQCQSCSCSCTYQNIHTEVADMRLQTGALIHTTV